MKKQNKVGMSGLFRFTINCSDPSKANVEGFSDIVRHPDGAITFSRKNAFVNTGLNLALDLLFGNGGPPASVNNIGVSSDNTAVTATTTTLGGTVSIKTLTSKTRTAQTVAAKASFTQADVAFSIRKVGLLNTSTDAGTGLLDVIGGSGVSPYNKPFTIDLTGVTTWTLVMECDITAAAI